ncbi:GNAT family N-acetyltransferase [Streptomyces sp. A012304]|uniref:GNAT family N-acetyltransferase n=1 Tax=Streptomyces sp. A012304 TaxID=375446 RepID=UPI002230DE42|nr:GNAT family N-acetyltransferase [Streptomyces sp. A012304]
MTPDPATSPFCSIRPRVPADLDACVAALAPVHTHSDYPVNWPADPAAWLTPPALLEGWVAELDGRIVGHAALCRATDGDPAPRLWGSRRPGAAAACVSRLFVAPSVRGLGVGAALMERAVGEALSRGLHPVLEVVASHPSVAFYERLGWELLGVVDERWGPDQLVSLRCYAAPVEPDAPSVTPVDA